MTQPKNVSLQMSDYKKVRFCQFLDETVRYVSFINVIIPWFLNFTHFATLISNYKDLDLKTLYTQ